MTDETSDGTGGERDAAATPSDQKARFRAALDRKAGRHTDAAGHTPQAMHPHTAPAKPQRTFRRKSG